MKIFINCKSLRKLIEKAYDFGLRSSLDLLNENVDSLLCASYIKNSEPHYFSLSEIKNLSLGTILLHPVLGKGCLKLDEKQKSYIIEFASCSFKLGVNSLPLDYPMIVVG